MSSGDKFGLSVHLQTQDAGLPGAMIIDANEANRASEVYE